MSSLFESQLKGELGRLVPPTRSAANWADVVRRSNKVELASQASPTLAWRARVPRPLAVAAALVLGALLAGGAYALVRYVIVGTPAPPAVRVSENLLNQVENEMRTLNHRNEVEVGRTRAAAVLDSSVGPVYLWVAPTTQGSQCVYVQIVGLDLTLANHSHSPYLMQPSGVDCVDPNQKQPTLNIITTPVRGHTVSLVFGHVPPPARTLQLRFANGQATKPFPITNGFVLVEGKPNDPRPTVIVRDEQGRMIDKHPFWLTLIPLRVMNTPVGASHIVATMKLQNYKGEFVLRVGPAANGGTCEQLQTPFGVSSGCGPHKTQPNENDVFLDSIGDISYLKGPVGTNIATVELQYTDGTHQTLPIQHGYVLFELPAGKQPHQLISRNRAGAIITARYISR